MTISTKGRYALRVLVDLAENGGREYIPMKEVADRQGISLKYLERILPVLTQNRILEGVHGRGGGYRLTQSPEKYTVGSILRLVEGDFAPVACLECGAAPCARESECRTLPMWKGLYRLMTEYLDGITLRDLMRVDPDRQRGINASFLDASL